jgi:hypothetical protein
MALAAQEPNFTAGKDDAGEDLGMIAVVHLST